MATEKTALTSSGVNLTSNFYLKNFYRFNRNAIKATDRKDFSTTELSYEDTRALRRGLAKLSSFRYEKGENGDNLVNSIKAFTETYNNTIDTTSAKGSDIARLNKQLKTLTQKYGEDLKDIGITLDKDGKMSVKENILKSSSFDEIGRVFSDDTDYMKGLNRIAKRMNGEAYDDVYAMMTGCGGRLNVQL